MRTTVLLKEEPTGGPKLRSHLILGVGELQDIHYLLVTCCSQQKKPRPRENQEFYIDTKTHFSSPIYSYAEHTLLLNDFNFWEEETKQFWGIKE